MEITRTNIISFKDVFQKELDELLEKHKLKSKIGHIKFDSSSMTLELKMYNTEKVKNNEDVLQLEFERECFKLGISKDFFGKCFKSNNILFRITGINSKARKYPIIAMNMNTSESFKFSFNYVKDRLVKEEELNEIKLNDILGD